MQKTFTVTTPEDFQEVITFILENTTHNSLLLALQGDLGAGKTTFTQQLAAYFGVVESVTSPTFTIMKMYELQHERFDQLVHIDAYRLEDEAEAVPLRLQEIMSQPRTVACLEWPEQIPGVIPPDAIKISITINPDESRQVTISQEVGN